MSEIKALICVSRIIYPKYHPFWFIFYMYLQFYRVFKRRKQYSIKSISESIIFRYMTYNTKYAYDVNNIVIVNSNNVYYGDLLLNLVCKGKKISCKVFVMKCSNCPLTDILVSNTFLYNHPELSQECVCQLLPIDSVKIADELEISLVSCPSSITNNAFLDNLIESYFKHPKIVRKGDIIKINVKYFAPGYFYNNMRMNKVKDVYLKCNKILIQDKEVKEEYFCLIGKTAFKQSMNQQSYIPKFFKMPVKELEKIELGFKEVDICPYGLKNYLDELETAFQPFLERKQLDFQPVFLLVGEEGCGSDILLESLASRNGLHLYSIPNSDLCANVYAQNETKLHNTFFTAKLSAPCLVTLTNFQNFGKNNEAEYDERLINSFISQLNTLLENNEFPIILICCSSTMEIAPELKRIFLESFTIDAPTHGEREGILRWVVKYNDIKTDVDLMDVANKTHGFYYEDLNALVHHAQSNSRKKLIDAKENENLDDVSWDIGDDFDDTYDNVLTENDFETAIDLMQSNYNQSLGAPKVPKVQWSDVGGLTDVKDEIKRSINLPLRHPELFTKSGLSRSGILLFGPPGTGKTLIAKAVATECSVCFLTVKGPELLNMYVGQSEKNIREVFQRARQASPCIIFFDELDSLAPNRGSSGDSGGVMDRVVSQLLAEMDGLDQTGKIFIIGATNRPDLIDPALLRPGRFDKLLYVGPCTDSQSKTSVLKALTRKFNLDETLNLEDVVKICPDNITGADFYGICSNAWTTAAKRLIERIQKGEVSAENVTHVNVVVSYEDFATSIKNVKPSISEEDLKYFDSLKRELSSNYARTS